MLFSTVRITKSFIFSYQRRKKNSNKKTHNGNKKCPRNTEASQEIDFDYSHTKSFFLLQ